MSIQLQAHQRRALETGDMVLPFPPGSVSLSLHPLPPPSFQPSPLCQEETEVLVLIIRGPQGHLSSGLWRLSDSDRHFCLWELWSLAHLKSAVFFTRIFKRQD